MKKLSKIQYISETKILTEEFSELLGLYFVCEKIAKKIAPNKKTEDYKLHLKALKAGIKKLNLSISEYEINLIFNTGWENKKKNQISFRNIRDSVCHNCSISNRDFAVKHKEQYKLAMQNFINRCCE